MPRDQRSEIRVGKWLRRRVALRYTDPCLPVGTLISLTKQPMPEVMNPIYDRLEDEQSLLRRSGDVSMLAEALLDVSKCAVGFHFRAASRPESSTSRSHVGETRRLGGMAPVVSALMTNACLAADLAIEVRNPCNIA